MSQSEAQAFNEKLRAGVEQPLLPLTQLRTPRGIIMAMVQGGAFARYGYPNAGWNALTSIVSHPSGRIGIETHTRERTLAETGVYDLVRCVSHCGKYIVDENVVLSVSRQGGIPEKYSASDMFELDSSSVFSARLLRENIERGYSYLKNAPPRSDVFHSGNLDAQRMAVEIVRGHEIVNPALRIALDGLRRPL